MDEDTWCICSTLFAHQKLAGKNVLLCKCRMVLWHSALQHHTTAAPCVEKFLMRGHRFEPQRSKDSVNGHCNVSPHATTPQQARHTATVRLQPEKSPTVASTHSAAVKVSTSTVCAWSRKDQRSNQTIPTLLSTECTWSGQPVNCGALRLMTVILHRISAIHVEVPLNFTRSMSEWTKFRLRQSNLTRFLRRKRTQMQHNLLPPTNP